jgi:hypothetical protein
MFPSGQAFGIVAVNEGFPNNTNPCLEDEISSAQSSVGGTRQPKASLYVNSADPGHHGVTTGQPATPTPPSGTMTRTPTARAMREQPGVRLAVRVEHGADGRADPRCPESGEVPVVLELETANSWQSSTRDNRADLEGMACYFRHIGAQVGGGTVTVTQVEDIIGEQRFLLPCSAAEG